MHRRVPVALLSLVALLGLDPTPASADEPGAFELAMLTLVVPSDQALQVALRIPAVGQTPGFLEHCARVDGSVVVKESGSGGSTLASVRFELTPGDVLALREPLNGEMDAASATAVSLVGVYLDVLVLVDQRSRVRCLDGAVNVIAAEGTPRPGTFGRKTLKAADL